MPKMTKQAVKELAQKIGDTQRDVLTIEQLDGEMADYLTRRNEANRLAGIAADLAQATQDIPASLASAFRSDVEDRVMATWADRIKSRDNARKAWQRAISGLSYEQASVKMVTLAESMRLRGATISGGYSGLRIEVERAWSIGAVLYVKLDRDYDAKRVNPDDSTQCAGEYRLTTELSWSGTNRTLAEATASVAVYQELIAAGAEIEAVMQRERIIWTYGIPEPVPETAQEETATA